MKLSALKTTVLLCAATISLSFAQENLVTWLRYKDITITTTSAGANVSGTVTNFPLLVRLTSAQADVFSQAAAGGTDIRFAKTDGTALPYQRERWDAGNQVAEFWVLVDAVAGNSTTTLRMHWGKNGAADLSNGGAVFDTANGFRSVWHLGDTTGVAPRPNAVAPYANLKAKPVNFPTGTYTPASGAIGLADAFTGGDGGVVSNGSTRYMKVDSGEIVTNAYRFPNGRFTATFWTNSSRFGSYRRHYQMLSDGNESGTPQNAIQSITGTTSPGSNYFRYRTGETYYGGNAGGNVLVANTWQHIAHVVVRGASTDTLIKYLNGVEFNRVTATTLLADAQRNYLFFGRSFESEGDSSFAGTLDEMAFANARRSPNWIKLSYETQKPGTTVTTLGATQLTASVPGAPKTVAATAGNAQAAVSWLAPDTNGGATITLYTATAAPGGRTCSTTGNLACIVTGLTNGQAYTFTVTAANVAGTGPASTTSSVVTPTDVAGAPGAPTITTATGGNAQVTVSWTAGTTGSSATTGYTVRSNPDTKTCETTSALTCAVTSLTNGQAYTFTVVATNVSGSSAPSAVSSAVTPAGPPGAPTGVTGTAGNAQATLSWTAPASNNGAAITGYTVTSAPGGLTCTTTTARTCSVTGLTNGTGYTFTVTATNSVGTSPASAPSGTLTPVAGPTVPGAPQNLFLFWNPGIPPAGLGTINVYWEAPASNGGAAITGYTATATPGGASCTTTGTPECTISGLSTQNYSVSVTATNSAGTGPAATANVTSIASARLLARTGYSVTEGPAQSLRLTVRDAGEYTVQIADLDGTVRKVHAGQGPVTGHQIPVGSSGVFVVRVTTAHGTHATLVNVR